MPPHKAVSAPVQLGGSSARVVGTLEGAAKTRRNSLLIAAPALCHHIEVDRG